MVDFNLPHRRFNPLTGDWVLVSPHRNRRPWQGSIEASQQNTLPPYDPACYLCPGNKRAENKQNPKYAKTFVFTNDHAAILPEVVDGEMKEDDLFRAQQEYGTCKVVCYTPAHNKTIADLSVPQIMEIIKTWTHEYKTIGADPKISYIQFFENKGPMMGASSPHPHSQIWANEHIPTIPAKEEESQTKYYAKNKTPLLAVYLREEIKKKLRLLLENTSFAVVVPYWAVWPYETMILPKTNRSSLSALQENEVNDLAHALKKLAVAYDKLFSTPFPYSMGIHQCPTDKKDHEEWQLHFHFYPPLLRSATIKKHYVGYEMMAEAQRDITPEQGAETLRKYI